MKVSKRMFNNITSSIYKKHYEEMHQKIIQLHNKY